MIEVHDALRLAVDEPVTEAVESPRREIRNATYALNAAVHASRVRYDIVYVKVLAVCDVRVVGDDNAPVDLERLRRSR